MTVAKTEYQTDQQLKSYFLNRLSIVLFLAHIVLVAVMLYPPRPSWDSFVFVAVALSLILSAYFLSHRNHLFASSYLLTILINFELLLAYTINLIPSGFDSASVFGFSLALPILICGMVIGTKQIIPFTIVNILLLSIVTFPNAPDGNYSPIFPILIFLTVTAAVSWLYQTSLNKSREEIRFLFEQVNRKSIELQAKNNELTRLDVLKDEFLANTSHELRTPLNGIIGLAESLLDGATGPLSPTTADNLHLIMNSGRRLARLVNDILDFSKLRHADLTLTTKPIHMRGVTDVVMTLSKPLIGPKKLELINTIDPETPLAQADEDRIQQIMYNLIGNAIKFTPAGTVTVTAETQGNLLAITVSDTGIGIPLDAQTAIFELFEQVDGSAEREQGGTGLGLAVTKQLVELHGGRITVDSQPGEGAHFTFTLPRADATAVPASPTTETAISHTFIPPTEDRSDEFETPTLSADGNTRGRVLVVDDEEVNRRVALNHLTTAGYEVVLAADGPEALNLLKQQPFDLVLLDIMMPYMSGLKVCQQLRQEYTASELPILMVTAKNLVADLVEGYNAGANDYLAKPYSKNELIARIKTHIELSRITRNLEQRVNERTAELQELVQELDLFSRTVAHDLKTPLGGVIGYGEILAEDHHEMGFTERSELINNIIRSGFRMRSIIDGLLMLARTRSKQIETTPLNMARMIQDIEDRFAYQIQQQNVTFEIQPNIPNAYGESTWVSEVLANYISNAIKYGGDPPHVQIGANELPNGMIRYWVKDNGQGIPTEKQSTLFTPFTRLNHNNKTDSHGLGLSIVERIISRLGGEVGLESETGRGSTFYFTLPKASETIPQTQDVFL